MLMSQTILKTNNGVVDEALNTVIENSINKIDRTTISKFSIIYIDIEQSTSIIDTIKKSGVSLSKPLGSAPDISINQFITEVLTDPSSSTFFSATLVGAFQFFSVGLLYKGIVTL